jgi:hypothetical protein
MENLSQYELVADLAAVFPEFQSYCAAETAENELPSESLHSVYQLLLPFLGTIQPSPQQWRRLADLLSREVAVGGVRENAADTCLLEHLHQVKLNRVLRPLLSPTARSMVRA